MTRPDFTYRPDGAFVALHPETPEAEKAWAQLAALYGERCHVPAWHFADVRKQLRAAGYTMRKAAPASRCADDDALLAALAE